MNSKYPIPKKKPNECYLCKQSCQTSNTPRCTNHFYCKKCINSKNHAFKKINCEFCFFYFEAISVKPAKETIRCLTCLEGPSENKFCESHFYCKKCLQFFKKADLNFFEKINTCEVCLNHLKKIDLNQELLNTNHEEVKTSKIKLNETVEPDNFRGLDKNLRSQSNKNNTSVNVQNSKVNKGSVSPFNRKESLDYKNLGKPSMTPNPTKDLKNEMSTNRVKNVFSEERKKPSQYIEDFKGIGNVSKSNFDNHKANASSVADLNNINCKYNVEPFGKNDNFPIKVFQGIKNNQNELEKDDKSYSNQLFSKNIKNNSGFNIARVEIRHSTRLITCCCSICRSEDNVKGFMCNHNLCLKCIVLNGMNHINDHLNLLFVTKDQIPNELYNQIYGNRNSVEFFYSCPVNGCDQKVSISSELILLNLIKYLGQNDKAFDKFTKYKEYNMEFWSSWIPYFDGISFDYF